MSKPASLEEFIAVNAEILALTRGGLPLAPELTRAAASVGSRTSGLATRLGERIEAGQSLGEAIDADGSLPPYYAMLVRAGEACGRLPAALQGLSEALARTLHLRRTCFLAFMYPAFVIFVAWTLMQFSFAALLPEYEWIAESSPNSSLGTIRSVITLIAGYGPLVLIAAWLGWVVSCWRSRGPLATPLNLCASLPGVRNVLKLTAAATYSRLLALMLQNRTPLPESLELAAEATGWPAYSEPSKRIAATLREGGALSETSSDQKQLPPLVRPALALDGDAQAISETIAQAASAYEERASLAADTTAVLLPVIASAVLGGGAVLIYAVAMFLPYTQSLREIAGWF